MRLSSLLSGVALSVIAGAMAAQADPARTIVVMDGSGSMWGQIDGRPKLEIARETLGQVLATLPDSQELGLLAYGHRRRGDCADIELLVPPASGQSAAILDAAKSMRFQGKTPLTEAVRQAAIGLRSTEEPATVVLITDGIETCEGDPCALGRELEQSGVDFTAHVVGFGLTEEEGAGLACLATETGGKYLGADDAEALRDALSTTIAQAPEPTPEPAEPAFALPTATLQAEASAPRGTQITVSYTGPAREGDYIDIAPFDGSGTHSVTSAAVEGPSGSVTLDVPAEMGDYVLRYVTPITSAEADALGEAAYDRGLAVQPLKVVDVEKFISAPATAEQGTMIAVDWAGPEGDEDWIGVFRTDYLSSDAYLSAANLADGSPAALKAPLDPGEYVAAYVLSGSDGEDLLVQAPFTVVPAQGRIEAPSRVPPGATFPLRFVGATESENWVDLVAAGEEDIETIAYSYLADQGPDAVFDMTMQAPETPGTYDLRYVVILEGARVGNDDLIVLRQPLIVDPTMEDAPTLPDAQSVPAPQEASDEPAPQDDISALCTTEGGCPVTDAEAGISYTLPNGWAASLPVRSGPEAPVEMTFFGLLDQGQTVTLNMPEDLRGGSLCLPSAAGELCHSEDSATDEAFTTLLRSLKLK